MNVTRDAGHNQGHRSLLDKKYFSRRWVLVYLMSVVRICQAVVRQCIGMALVCMTHVNSSDVSHNISTVPFVPRNGSSADEQVYQEVSDRHQVREFQWSSQMEGHVLGAYYYGFLLTVLAGSYVDRALGSVRTIAVGVSGGAVVNLLTPQLTRLNAYILVVLRILAGCANGIIDPAVHSLLSRWAPVTERGQLAAVEYGGISAAGVLTFLISAFLCQIPVDNGWPFVFYFYGSTCLIFTVIWMAFARDSPENHPSITARELEYITSNRSELRHSGKAKPPWTQILKSGAVWAIMVAHVSFSWVYSWILAYLPMYMEDVLHYSISQNGVLSSLPFLAKLLSGLVAGYLADMLIRHNVSIVAVRKAFQIMGSVGCAVPVLIISFLTYQQRTVAVALLILSVALQNLTSVAYRINSLDIAPRYASYLMGITSAVACGMTLTAPYVTSAVLTTKSQAEWQVVLYLVAAVSVAGGLVFICCAQGHVLPWARDDTRDIYIEVKINGSLEGDSAARGEVDGVDDVDDVDDVTSTKLLSGEAGAIGQERKREIYSEADQQCSGHQNNSEEVTK